jgi:hypothetical protein
MPQNQLPLWLQYVQAVAVPILTIVIALFGAWIAREQMKIARTKLQHDLYDRRFAVFQAARKLLAELVTHGTVLDEDIRAYRIGTADSVFLFDQDLTEYLEEIGKRVTKLRSIITLLNSLPTGEKRNTFIDAESDILSWMIEQLPNGLIARFKPYLTLSSQRPSPARHQLLAKALGRLSRVLCVARRLFRHLRSEVARLRTREPY